MNEQEPFIIEDLDDYHLVIKADEEQRVRRELEAEVNTLPYLPYLSELIEVFFSWRRTRIALSEHQHTVSVRPVAHELNLNFGDNEI